MKNKNIFPQLRAATCTLLKDGPGAATAVIQKALKSATGAQTPFLPGSVPGSVPGRRFDFVSSLLARLGVPSSDDGGTGADKNSRQPISEPGPAEEPVSDTKSGGRFLTKSFTNPAGTRAYKLYIPSGYQGQALPVVVMLHGCTQNPDDFANGTRMNTIAEEQHYIVIYPAQSPSANSSKCWNWFNSIDQQRDQGEPSIIAGITREVISQYGLDAGKVYVAGLSAGGAMAVIMATTYPELYAAVGVHSGLPYASARDLPSAFAAMRGNVSGVHSQNQRTSELHSSSMPIIVFHGDQDKTVNASNGDQLMKDNVSEFIVDNQRGGSGLRRPDVIIEEGQVPNGHRYTRVSYHDSHPDAHARTLAEHWVIHGAGHAWAGGSESGSYTDPRGPDATREMMRFFCSHSLPK